MTFEPNVLSFLQAAGWGEAKASPLQADFSTRRFTRLEQKGKRAILMQAAPDQKTAQFVGIAGVLRELDISAPMIYAARAEEGLVLMEDFGDTTLGVLMDTGRDAIALYRRAVDLLAHLHRRFQARHVRSLNLPIFNAALFADQAALYLDHYFPFSRKRAANVEERESFRDAWLEAMTPLDSLPQTLMLRDFMPDNLMDLPNSASWRGVGVLDFQDAGLGPMPYDLASLCECVRRNAAPSLLDDMTAYYHKQNPALPLADLNRACRILSALRHTRVLGIVTKLAETQGRRDKLATLPRISDTLHRLLQDDALLPVRRWFSGLPASIN